MSLKLKYALTLSLMIFSVASINFVDVLTLEVSSLRYFLIANVGVILLVLMISVHLIVDTGRSLIAWLIFWTAQSYLIGFVFLGSFAATVKSDLVSYDAIEMERNESNSVVCSLMESGQSESLISAFASLYPDLDEASLEKKISELKLKCQ